MAYELMNRVTEELLPIAEPDGKPKMMGRNISVGFTPRTGAVKKSAAPAESGEEKEEKASGEAEK